MTHPSDTTETTDPTMTTPLTTTLATDPATSSTEGARPENPIGIHALVWVGDTSPASVESAVTQTAAAGYDLLEFSLHDAVNLDRAATREALTRAGLGAACSRGLAPDADVSSEDPAVVARGAALLQESLAVTADIGATVLTGALYSAFGKAAQPLSRRGRDNVVSVLKELAVDAAARGVTLGLEVCNRYETNVVNTARDALALADDIGSDNVMVHLDIYHMNIEEDDFVQPVLDLGDRLGYVHIGENHRGYLGSGHLDFESFFAALERVSYRGPVTFESFSSAVLAPGLSNDLAIWRNLWDDGGDLARSAHAFIVEQLEAARSARSARSAQPARVG
ncbi:sugar phosphate isomerase/epimerase family protein [Terracoccus luteus]|uniref:D-psicose/D-tagatose/L-ribulose 3-epimerase n=1 Tax=Terracoccus luteus TaxID=53356 RepID=A0A839PT43_9MICO|nr:sugar phosphate isomerase/epimerase [Terracoccus luteus]MBB2987350.1 D-psicose/D-tagatose/L-ribulose 3-epimerase [Terracoccus luteus]MCP2173001.1 D-psicose/D-tagatose/L-ribulose 3-epimerase [Terracoccus luteus]